MEKTFQTTLIWKIMAVGSTTALLVLISSGLAYYLGSKKAQNPSQTDSLIIPKNPEVPAEATKSPTPSPKPSKIVDSPTEKANKIKIFSADKNLDGFVTSTGVLNNRTHIRMGRSNQSATRGFISFTISNFPKRYTLEKATLRIFQTEVVGKPYSVGGDLLVDHLVYGNNLDKPDYAFPALISSFGSLKGVGKIGWREIDVTDFFRDDLANSRSKSQFRLHFEKETRGSEKSDDYVYFESAENFESTGNTPELVVKYYQ